MDLCPLGKYALRGIIEKGKGNRTGETLTDILELCYLKERLEWRIVPVKKGKFIYRRQLERIVI